MLMAAAAAAQGTAISVAMDKTAGIFARFRTMAIARASVLTGHVLGSVIQSVLAMTTLLVVAVALGFRPSASALDWLALLGFVTLVAFALTWLTVAMGLSAATVEVASNSPMFLVILPFLSSGFVPVESMPTWLGWVAEHQPFTPMIETTRGFWPASRTARRGCWPSAGAWPSRSPGTSGPGPYTAATRRADGLR